MKGAIYRRTAARRDLIEHYVYLAENASPRIADRFLANAEDTFRDLARHPEMGAQLALKNPLLDGLRKWRIKDFENYLSFYIPRANGILIVRVLHGAQDWWRILGIDEA